MPWEVIALTDGKYSVRLDGIELGILGGTFSQGQREDLGRAGADQLERLLNRLRLVPDPKTNVIQEP